MLTSRFWTPDASGSAVPELWFSQGARARGLTYGDLGARAAGGRGAGRGRRPPALGSSGDDFAPSLGSVAIVAVRFAFLSSPDGSYTEEQSQESEVKVLATDFDDEFDDEEPLPAIGTCKALYTFDGNTSSAGAPHSPSMARVTPLLGGVTFEAFQIFLLSLLCSAHSVCQYLLLLLLF